MLTNIRLSTFETNSSSCHSIVVKNGSYQKRDYEAFLSHSWYDPIIIKGGEFGTFVDEYDSPYDKLSYIWTCLLNRKEDLGWWEAYLYQALGLDATVVQFDYDCGVDCYVDHAEEKTELLTRLSEDEDFLRDFVFGDSRIITGNDYSDEEIPWPWNLEEDELEAMLKAQSDKTFMCL